MVFLTSAVLLSSGCVSGSRARRGATATGADAELGKSADSAARLSDAEMEERVKAFAHFAAGVSSELNDNEAAAMEHYLAAAAADPGHEALVVELTRRLLANKQTEKAIALLKTAASSPEASGGLFALLGVAYAEAGQTEQAIRANRNAIKRSPDLSDGYRNLVALYLDGRKYAEALEVLDTALAGSSKEPRFWVDLAGLYATYGSLRREEAEAVKAKAVLALDRSSSLKPLDIDSVRKLADGYKMMGELEKAEPFYLELIDRLPSLPGTREKLADIYLRLHKKDKAAEQIEAISRADPGRVQPHYLLGVLARQENRLSDAAGYFEMALALKPDLEPAYYELAGLKVMLDKADEALEVLEKARNRFGRRFAIEYFAGVAHARSKNYGSAVRHFTEAEVIARANEPERLTHSFYFEFGAALERNGEFAEAEKCFRKCLELLPNFSEAMNYLGYMWADRGENLGEARKLIEKAVELEPQSAAYLDSMAWVLFKLKAPREAIKWIRKAIEHSDKPDPTLYDHLGDIHAELGEQEKAREAWRKSLDLEPNDKVKQKLGIVPPEVGPRE